MDINKTFLLILNMSLTAGYVMVAIVIIRACIKKSAKWVIGILWLVVFIRLLLPVSFSSEFSIFSTIPQSDIPLDGILFSEPPEIHSGLPYINSIINPAIKESARTQMGISIIHLAAAIWAVGFAAILIYSIISYVKLKRSLSSAVILFENVFQSDKISAPFVVGFFKPRIYIPFGLSDESLKNVLLHENAHILRKDHIIKPLAFLLSSIHWFNPLIWTAYFLFSSDIEMACDEKAIKKMDTKERKTYSDTLLSLSANKNYAIVCPIAFGEVSVKQRIKKALSYKKPPFWLIIGAFIITTAAVAALIANPVKEKDSAAIPDSELFGTYYPIEVVYVNPLSSFYPYDLSKAPYYFIGESEFAIFSSESREKLVSEKYIYEISEITEDEFRNMFMFGLEMGMPEVSGYNTIRKVVISEKYTLLLMDSQLWIAEINGDFLWIIYRLDSKKTEANISESANNNRLTIERLKALVDEKGENLSWSDFQNYEYSDIGSGLFILHVPIDSNYSVFIGGIGLKEEPMYIYLKRWQADNSSENCYIDLLDKDIDLGSFIDITENRTP